MKTKISEFRKDIFLSFKNLPRTIELALRTSPLYFFFSIILMIPESLIPPAQLWITKLVVDSVVNQIEIVKTGGEMSLLQPFLLVGLQLFLWVVREAVDAIKRPIATLLEEKVGHRINLMLAEKAASVDLCYHDIPEFHDKLTRAGDYTRYPLSNLTIILQLIPRSISLAIVIAMLARLGWLPLTVTLATVIPHVIFKLHFSRRNWTLRVNYTPDLRLMDYVRNLLIGRKYAKEIRIFRLKDYLLERFHGFWAAFFQERSRIFLLQNATSALSGIVAGMGCAFVYGYAIYKAIGSQITIGDLTLYIQVTNLVQSYLIEAFYQLAQFYEIGLSQRLFYEFMDMDTNKPMPGVSNKQTSSEPVLSQNKPFPHPLKFGIELRNVSFKYPGSEHYVLKNLSLMIPARKKIALVGENGAGKTTLIKLITRLYDVIDGEILLDGRPLHEYNRQDLWKHVSAIFQDFGQYELTVRENIGFGWIEKIEYMDSIRAAAERVGAKDFIERLPKGYESYLGRYFEDPVDLSGGEWQKIALARSFIADSKILILDEPTASLDARAEYEFYTRIDELTKGKTVIFASHRFSTVRMADEILVMKNGQIIEYGSHNELIAMNGLYAEMFNMQASRYVS